MSVGVAPGRQGRGRFAVATRTLTPFHSAFCRFGNMRPVELAAVFTLSQTMQTPSRENSNRVVKIWTEASGTHVVTVSLARSLQRRPTMREILKAVGKWLIRAALHEAIRAIWEQVRDKWHD